MGAFIGRPPHAMLAAAEQEKADHALRRRQALKLLRCARRSFD